MSYLLVEILSYSVAVAAIISLVRIRKLDRAYDPFVCLLWAGVGTQVATSICNRVYRTNVIPSNIYSLIESLLILWFFYNMRLLQRRQLVWASIFYIMAWTASMIAFSPFAFCSYFNILYGFITVLLSIHMINKLLLFEKGMLLRHPLFLISISFIVYFTLSLVIEIFWLYGFSKSGFALQIFRLMTYVNLAVNLIFIFAVLWIPRKPGYILPSSQR